MDVDKLRNIMQEQGITRAELAQKSGVNKRTIEGWFDTKHKTFNPTISEFSKVANALGVSLDVLVGVSPLSEPESFYGKYSQYKELLSRIDELDLNSVALINDIIEVFYKRGKDYGGKK